MGRVSAIIYALYFIVKVLSRKVLNNSLGHYFLRLQLVTGPPFLVITRAQRRSSRLQMCKGSTFTSDIFQDPEYSSGPGNRTRDLPLCGQALYRLN